MPYCSGMTISFPDPLAHARDFYLERMCEAFQHTGRFAGQTQRTAEQVIDTPDFNAVLRGTRPWWRDLYHYKRGWCLQTATIFYVSAGMPGGQRP